MAKYILAQQPVGNALSNAGPCIWTSDDAITWTARSSIFDGDNYGFNAKSKQVLCLATDGTIILAGGQRDYADGPASGSSSAEVLVKSTDGGETWAAVSTPWDVPGLSSTSGGQPNFIQGLWYSPERSLWMAVGGYVVSYSVFTGFTTSNQIATSPDGVTWTLVTCPDTSAFGPYFVYFAAGAWWAGWQGHTGKNHLWKSTDDGATWTGVTTAFVTTAGQGRAMRFSKGLFVLAGARGTTPNRDIETSPDASTWTLQTSGLNGFGADCVVYAYSLGLWVVGAASSTNIDTSPDGTTWTNRSGNLMTGTLGVDYNYKDGVFIACCRRNTDLPGTNTVSTSTNGTTWTGRGDPGSPTRNTTVGGPKCVMYNPPVGRADLVAVGESIDAVKSLFATDDVTKTEAWRLRSSVFNFNDAGSNNGQVWSVCTDGTVIVAVGDFGTSGLSNANANPANSKYPIARSSDGGKTWTNPTIAAFAPSTTGLPIKGVAWSSDRSLFMAVGGVVGNISRSATSPDGTTWTTQSGPFFSGVNKQPNCIVYGASKWVMGAKGVKDVAYSTDDGASWTNVTIFASNTNVNRIVWNGSMFVLCWDGGVKTSTDGITWTDQGSPLSSIVMSAAWSDTLSLWVIVGNGINGTSIATSPDGVTWTTHGAPPGTGFTFSEVVWQGNNSRFAAIVSSTSEIYTSADGSTWTSRGRAAGYSGTIQMNAMVYHPPPPPVLRSFSGSISSSGALATQRVAHVAVDGAISPSGALGLLRTARLSLAGAISSSGALGLVHTPGGVVDFVGVLGRVVNKVFSGTITPAGNLDIQSSHQLLFGAASSLAGVLANVVGKTFAGSTDPAGTVRPLPRKVFGGSVASSSEIHLRHTAGTPTWISKTVPPLHQPDAGLAAYGGKIYAFGGAGPLVYIQCYDPSTGSWSRKADLPTAMDNIAAITLDSKIWLFGEPSGPYALVYIYDPVANTVVLAPIPGPMPPVNFGSKPIIAYANNRFWVISTSNQCYKLDPSNLSASWVAGGSPRPGFVYNGVACVAIGTKIYHLGGGFPSVTDAKVFDTVAGTWTSLAVLPHARYAGKALLVSNKIWLVGGRDASFNPMTSVDIYDPSTNTWSSGPADLSGLDFADGVVLNPPYILRDTGSSSFFEEYPTPPVDATIDIEIDMDVFPYPWGHTEPEIDLTVDAVATVTSVPQLIPGFVFSGVQPADGEG